MYALASDIYFGSCGIEIFIAYLTKYSSVNSIGKVTAEFSYVKVVDACAYFFIGSKGDLYCGMLYFRMFRKI